MRTIPVALLVLCVASAGHAAELDVHSTTDAVTVYPDGATVTRVIHVDLPQGDSVVRAADFPPGLDPASLRVEGAGQGRIVIGAVDARLQRPGGPPANPELERQVAALKDERGALDDKIAAENARKKFVAHFADKVPAGLGDKGEARPLAEWRAAFAAVADEIAGADDAIRAARKRRREIDRTLAGLEADLKANPPRKMEVHIDLAAAAATAATLRVTYSVRGARWLPLYDARLDTGTTGRPPALELVRRAEIVQQTGEDWTDVALAVSTARTAKGGTAPELRPLIVHYPRPPRPVVALPRMEPFAEKADMAPRAAAGAAVLAPPAPVPALPAAEREAQVETGGYQVLFRIPGRVSVAAGDGAKSFRVATAAIAPTLRVRAVPALDPTAYLEARFRLTGDAPLLPGRVSIYRDGVYVGRGEMALTPTDGTVRLGFGADDNVKITRAIVRKAEGSSGIMSAAKTDEREFKIVVHNGHASAVRVTVEDQVPVSESEDVTVEMLPATTPPTARDVHDRRGVLAWTFDAAAGETHEITLGWRVRWPADKTITYDAGQR